MHSIYVWFQTPAHVALACSWAGLVISEALPFTKGRANGILQGIGAVLGKVKAAEEAKK